MKPLAWVILAVLAIYAITAIIVFWPSKAPDMSPQIQKLETEKAKAKERAQAAEHTRAITSYLDNIYSFADEIKDAFSTNLQ